MTETRQVNCRLPQDLVDGFDEQARLQKASRTNLMISLLQEGLEQFETRFPVPGSSHPSIEQKAVSLALEERVATLERYIANNARDSIALEERVATLENYVTSNITDQLAQLRRYLSQLKKYIDSQLAERIATIDSFIAKQTELQLQIDNLGRKLTQLEKISATAQTSLHSPSYQDNLTNAPKKDATLHSEPQPALANEELVNSIQESDALTPAAPSIENTEVVTTDDEENLMTTIEGYNYAVARGYRRSCSAFQKLVNSKDPVAAYAKLGLEADLSRRGSRGYKVKWLRPLR